MKLPCILFLLCACSGTAVFGARQIELRTLALEDSKQIPKRHVKLKQGFQELSFSALQPGALIAAEATETILPLFELKQNDRKEMVYQLAEQIKLPAGSGGVLLLGWMDGKSMRYLALADDFSQAKYSDWLMINAANRPVSFQIGESAKPLVLQVGSTVLHSVQAKQQTGVPVTGKSQWGDQVKTFYSTYWPIWDEQRSIIIFFSRGERIAVRRISDVLLKPAIEKNPADQAPPGPAPVSGVVQGG